VVRHLAAGVLGANAPAPLKPDSLAQEIVWDGKADYGKPAEGGPLKVRVALGLSAKYDKVIAGNQHLLNAGICGLDVAPDSTLYVLGRQSGSIWGDAQLLAFNRDGTTSAPSYLGPAISRPVRSGPSCRWRSAGARPRC